jgi:hypothetical protein
LRELDGFDPIAGLTHHFHVGLHGNQGRGAPAHERLILRNDDPDRRMIGLLTGRHKRTLI